MKPDLAQEQHKENKVYEQSKTRNLNFAAALSRHETCI